jgi:hypothetical protein
MHLYCVKVLPMEKYGDVYKEGRAGGLTGVCWLGGVCVLSGEL